MDKLDKLCTVVKYGDEGNLALGTSLGGAQGRQTQMRQKTAVAQAVHDKLRYIRSSCAEYTLAKSCLGVCK
eukprot:4682519-Karenia_brevis.AAC.1